MEIKSGYRIPVEHKGCKFAQHGSDSVPMPFGIGNCSMPYFECLYDGEKPIPDDFVCSEKSNCIAYEPEETIICKTHNIEYYKNGVCEICHPESKDW